MKPRYRPGKPVTGGRQARKKISKAKPLSEEQMEHLKTKSNMDLSSIKAGKGGKRAKWNTDFEEGLIYDKKTMPGRESENISEEGIRKFPRNRR